VKDPQAVLGKFGPSIGLFHLSFQKNFAANLKSIFGVLFEKSLRRLFMTFIQSATAYVERNSSVAHVIELLRVVPMMHSTVFILEDKYVRSLKPLIVSAQIYGLGDFLKKNSFIDDLEATVIASFQRVIGVVGGIAKNILKDTQKR
jgi:hypothetical protein